MQNGQYNKGDDSFWNLDEYIKKKAVQSASRKVFSESATSAVEITSDLSNKNAGAGSSFSASPLTNSETDSTITRFIPPHKAQPTVKQHVLFSYAPENPLFKEIKICASSKDEQLFPVNNMFIRERHALLHKEGRSCEAVSYYSMSPRYSQMSRAQLNFYLWWRENARQGNFFPADESYLVLYAYELVTSGEGEDHKTSLDMLCALLQAYGKSQKTGPYFGMMLCDLICDYSLLHGLPSPVEKLGGFETLFLGHTNLPEFFIDLSENKRENAIRFAYSHISMYDYRRSKFYTEENRNLFDNAIYGMLATLVKDEKAFAEMISFKNGAYGMVTVHRRPFMRLVNIANRNVNLEISYFQISSMQATITDAIRYSENKIREHLGIKNKLHVLAVNPILKGVIDRYFEANYPALPVLDRRRKSSIAKTEETHEYDRFYDVPKAEVSPERALEIERLSWDTTKILTEAFSDGKSEEKPVLSEEITVEKPNISSNEVTSLISVAVENISSAETVVENEEKNIMAQFQRVLGEHAAFIPLCLNENTVIQREFAKKQALSIDELADRINEAAVDIIGDILLEDAGGYYTIIEDYIELF